MSTKPKFFSKKVYEGLSTTRVDKGLGCGEFLSGKRGNRIINEYMDIYLYKSLNIKHLKIYYSIFVKFCSFSSKNGFRDKIRLNLILKVPAFLL